VDARQYDDERQETGGFGAGAGKVQARGALRLPASGAPHCGHVAPRRRRRPLFSA
jgi:hypothetical protein